MDIKSIIPNTPKALLLAKRQLVELVYDAVNLEGINYTLPEVQTILDGVTVGGHKLSDQTITLNQGAAWRYLFAAIENQQFNCSKAFACELHAIAAKEEALEWGQFRTGAVTIAGSQYLPPDASDLDACWEQMLIEAKQFEDYYDQAIHVFLQMARNQFFYDVNKRMGRFMMNGLLLQHGYPAINISAKRQLEFNQLMLAFYDSNDGTAMNAFMKSCLSEQVIKIMSE